ncbi:CUB and sushi domain-containing protein 3-like isoform X2 [Halichondria panicea]|uniref:CUB and sushi domain-containing protein 3-like isoform X2 n=1 Tax=Halichondria panicea TaxID=6063 RepID=UPI00312B496E
MSPVLSPIIFCCCRYFCHFVSKTEATLDLMYNTSVACPGETVLFTCFVPGVVALQWRVDPPAESMLMSEVQINPFNIFSQVGRRDTFGSGVIMFEAVFVSNDDGNVTSTLINLSEVSVLDGSNVTCTATINNGVVIESQQTVTVAGAPTSPLNPIISSIQNQTLSSIITLDWDSPSSTGGVSVSYALTISPTPLSESPVTVETTSAQITISYDTHYTVTIKTVNCAGNSSALMVVIPAIVTCPSNPPPADRVTINGRPPLPVLIGSILSFTCNRQTVTATCESDGRWSSDPTTYMCLSVATCGSPAAPSRGSVDISGGTPPFSLGSEVTYRCDDGLFPLDVRTSTCTDVGGRGEWVENPGSLVCRERPVNCTVPAEPCNGAILDYERLNETVLEGTVLTYQCDNGFSLTGPNTITCTNAGVWSTKPEAIVCVLMTEVSTIAPLFSTSATVAISVVITFIVTLVIGFLTGLLVMHLFSRKKAVYFPATEGQANAASTTPVGPVYEEVSPKEDIELNTNQAYGPLGL